LIDTVKVRDAKDVVDAVQWAIGESRPIEIVGHGSKRGIGRSAQQSLVLDLSALDGITMYEPNELVFSAKAGTPMSRIASVLAESNQELAFEPLDYGPLFGAEPGRGTIGGVIAGNLSGPRRIKSGAARDHFLGVTAVTGRGETIKAGGRVMKNVTGYDVCKLLAGSWGTLAVMTDVTLKVLPRGEAEQTVVVHGLDDATAARAMTAAMNCAADVSGAAHLPRQVAERLTGAGTDGQAATVLRLEGVPPSVAHRKELLKTLLASYGTVSVLEAAESRQLWRSVRDVTPLTDDTANPRSLWRISTAPVNGHNVAAQIQAEVVADVLYDWGGGLVWIAIAQRDDAASTTVHRSIAAAGGHATLIRAPLLTRSTVDVFQPQDQALASLTKRLKTSFDPKGILNPGRMYAGV
jgi:glycolate oxidase FAD binding subunit